jgi:hypothetical protein
MASGVPEASTGMGVLPVVSTPMPTMRLGSNFASAARAFSMASVTDCSA